MGTEVPAGLLALQQEVPKNLIGKLPKVTCPECRKKENKGCCGNHKKERCRECGGWLTTAHQHLDYVGHAETTSKLLEVDPLWNWEPLAFGADGLPQFDADGGLWIRLTVCGVARLGYGTADNANGFKARGDIRKEIIGDAIRNAAMRFGWALDLWAKTDIHDRTPQEDEEPQGAPRKRRSDAGVRRSKPTEPAGAWTGEDEPAAPPMDSSATMAQLNMLNTLISKKYGNLPRDQRLATVAKLAGRPLASSKDLTKREASSIIEALNAMPEYSDEGREAAARSEAERLAETDPETDADRIESDLRDAIEAASDQAEVADALSRAAYAQQAGRIGKAAYDVLYRAGKHRGDQLAADGPWTRGISRAMDAPQEAAA